VRVKIVEERADAVLVGHVERGGRGAPARLADLARGGLERFRASPGDQDRRPLAREPPRDRLPDARPAAGDDRGPARQPASVPLHSEHLPCVSLHGTTFRHPQREV
jgi:hypothetical protein